MDVLFAFIRDCGWQVILSSVLLVQFLTIMHLRRVVREYDAYWYSNNPQVQQPMVQQQQATLRPLRPLRRR